MYRDNWGTTLHNFYMYVPMFGQQTASQNVSTCLRMAITFLTNKKTVKGMFINMFLNISCTLSITGYVQVEISKVEKGNFTKCLRNSLTPLPK